VAASVRIQLLSSWRPPSLRFQPAFSPLIPRIIRYDGWQVKKFSCIVYRLDALRGLQILVSLPFDCASLSIQAICVWRLMRCC